MSNLTNTLRISLDWEEPCAAQGEELRATWCRLAMQIGATPVTRVFDERAQTVRDAVYCSAYPLAEWLAFNWWPLLHEPERTSNAGERHNLRHAREGFALPNLSLFSEESLVRAVWKTYRPAAAPVWFLEDGFALLDRQSFQAEIAAFIGKVVARLESQGVARTALAEEWAAIQAIPKAEREFCVTAGALGLDPYALDDDQAEEILAVAGMLPPELKQEFFMAADATTLTAQAKWVSKCLRQLGENEIKSRLAGKKGWYATPARAVSPWQQGYELAGRFRGDFRLGSPAKPVVLENLFRSRGGSLPVIRVGDEAQLDAVARLAPGLGPQIATAKLRESSKGYLLARAICDYLCSGAEETALLTRVSSDRQKRNRAFAAELLAPAAGLRKVLSGSRISREEISEVAAHFGVSELLIEHQVRNHSLAELAADFAFQN